MRDRWKKEGERDGVKENEEGRLREERLLPGLIERLLCKWVHSAGAATWKREEQEKKRKREVNQCNKQGEGRSHELLMRTHFAWWGERQDRKVSELPGWGGLLQKHTRTLMSVVWEGTLTRLARGHIQASSVQKLWLRVETETGGEGRKWARTYGSMQQQAADASCCSRPFIQRSDCQVKVQGRWKLLRGEESPS